MSVSVKIDLTIALETGLSVGAGGTMGVLADKSALRDGYNRLIIPGSQVKGRLRHACEAIARSLGHPICEAPVPETMCPQRPDPPDGPPFPRDADGRRCCIICQIFGSPVYQSPLHFNDLVFIDPAIGERSGPTRADALETLQPGIGLNRRRGTVAEGLLFLLETSPAWLGEDRACFHNDEAIVGKLPGEEHLQLMLAGLRFLYAWGGGKSRGLGWGVVRAKVNCNGEVICLDESTALDLDKLARWQP